MFKELLLNVENIETVINDYFREKYSSYKVSLDEKKIKPNNKVYNVEFDGRTLFLSIFINKQGKITLKVKEGKEQDEKGLLATYIVNSSKCKLIGDTKNKSISFNNIEIDDFKKVMSLIEEEEWCTSCTLTEDHDIKLSYRIIGRYRDGLTVNYFKRSKKVNLQGLPLEVFNYTASFFNELLDIDEVINTMNEACNNNIEIDNIEQKYVNLMPNSHDKHNDKLKKSLIKSVYNLEVTCQNLTCTDLIFEPLRALEGHIIITLSENYGIVKPYRNNLSMFKYIEKDDIIKFKYDEDKSKVEEKDDKLDYYINAYRHIVKYRHRYFHWGWNEELGKDTTLHLDDIEVAKEIILDTLKLIDEYYI